MRPKRSSIAFPSVARFTSCDARTSPQLKRCCNELDRMLRLGLQLLDNMDGDGTIAQDSRFDEIQLAIAVIVASPVDLV